ncbi:calmodulin-binding sha1 [Pyrenophora seminiperda CCB06]|uniref:Calmodulin-binding sha1 n=1 Tax=Pyrenophora seminiperda CCB06 TaxID=1302712 RepID=A0A3M7M746_9PLEO|nr:calmodulin-binding sha1 [Pyrenophora seminiperda CCB06]
MYGYTAGTPCPAPYSSTSSHYSGYGSQFAPSYLDDNTTTNLEYTTELKAAPRPAKPRRPMRTMHKPAFNPSLDIFEDVAQEEQQHADFEMKRRSRASLVPAAARAKKSTILAHPAQKLPKPAPPMQEPQHERPHRRRLSQTPVEKHAKDTNATVQLQEEALERKELKKQAPKKDLRRRTIYVPSDDTSVFTIHPGQPTHAPRNAREASPDIGLDLVTLSEEEGNNLLPALKKRLPRKSLAAPPKRGPLSTTSRSTQSVSCSSDTMGSGGGKENVPPGLNVIETKRKGIHIDINFTRPEVKKPVAKVSKVHFNAPKEPERAIHTKKRADGTQKRSRAHVDRDDAPAKALKSKADATASAANSRASLRTTIKTERAKLARANRAPLSSSPFHTDRSPPTALRRHKTASVASSITMLHEVGQRPQPCEKYPVLQEDLAQPELYEDNWLTYQEVAITQLLNSVFDSATKDPNAEQSPEDLRKKMLAIYHGPTMPALHKRLQASLQFGALGIPKDLLVQALRLKDDIGLRKKFLNLWTKSYDLTALRAAVETIVGRQITTPCRLSTGSTCSDDGSRQYRGERRAIESFLFAFLIKNEDAVRVKSGGGSIASLTRGEDDFGSPSWSWRRTALRSLMLILILDQVKTTDALPGCLFQTTSPYKTSVEILHQLSKMLLPSHGDITRPLHHLNYNVEHIQYPLQEYTYQIDNIAIDLRDGIVLTRLVELLLCTSTAQREDKFTLTLPTGEVLISSCHVSQKDPGVLSQHLKYPAIGRPQKVYNIQIALAALSTVPDMPSPTVSGIRAEDIVDGHREKTLSLLWFLVGKCGLGSLVNWPQLVKETERFRTQWYNTRDSLAGRALDSDSEEETTSEFDSMAYHKRLLLSWSRSIARLHGLRVANLTTSFADPKVLEVIVDTYLPSNLVTTSMASSGKVSLVTKLKAVGCSASFIALFTPQRSSARPIPSRDFTLLTLSFLASRLLPLARTHRAASTIQAAFRRFSLRRQTSNRIALLKISHECAVVAQARQRLVDAATVIQRRWKAIQDQKRVQLESDVLAFQALARGWAIRRWVRRITAGRVGGKEKVRRVRGGW